MQLEDKALEKEPPGVASFHEILLAGDVSLPITSCIPRDKKHSHLYENGVSHLLPRLTLTVESELEECFKLWEKFSPKKSLFDLWDFRVAWHEGYTGSPHFYTIYEGKNPLAVLPLWFDQKENRFTWFGTEWMEDNNLAVKDVKFIDLLLAVMPSPLHLNAVEDMQYKNIFERYVQVKEDQPKNIKELEGISSMSELLATFTKKHRYNLKADFRKISAMKPRIEVIDHPQTSDLNELIELNKKRFDGVQKESSAFFDDEEVSSFHNIVNKAQMYKIKFIKVYIDGVLISSDMIATYNGTYYPLRGGSDVQGFHGIGNYMMYLEFEDALGEKCVRVDCLQEDNGWKHRYFDQTPVYLLKK